MRSVKLDGLTVDAAGELLAHVVGEPVERGVVYALWGLSRGAPAALIQLGVRASAYPTAEFVAAALDEGPPPFAVDTPQDRRLLGLLAAVPGVELSAEQLAAASGVPDVAGRLRRWVDCGLVTASATRTYRFAAASSTRPSGACRTPRGAGRGLRDLGPAHPNAVLVAGGRRSRCGCSRSGPTAAVLARRARDRGLLDVAYAAAGHWDAWRSCLQATLEAARALGDQAAEALALHQLGTGALCRGDLATAHSLLSARTQACAGRRASPRPQRSPGRTWRRSPTDPRPPAPRWALGRIPTPVKAVAVLLPLLGSLAFVGRRRPTPSARLDPQQLAFVDQVVDKASAPQVIRLTNDGPAALHIENVALSGRTTAGSRWSTRPAW